jgi:L-erythro-3,5-diaminohexanoate dehydrogenase
MGTDDLVGRFGLARVLEPPGAFPQAAWRLDATPVVRPDELLVRVERLKVDAASFRQLSTAAGGDAERIADELAAIVADRGKLHNPVTGSGGMLVGTVAEIGDARVGELEPGARIATLVSLTLTPLRLERILDVDLVTGQIGVEGTAVLFGASPYAPLPSDLPRDVALAALDVAGAPARTAATVRPGDRVAVVGAGGTSGLLCLHAARRATGPAGAVIAIDRAASALADAAATELADAVVAADATDALALRESYLGAAGSEADVSLNLVDVAGTELGTVLITRPAGTVLFFSMTTSFAAAALGAEGLGRETTMLIGNGFMPDRGAVALAVLRENSVIRGIFERRHAA